MPVYSIATHRPLSESTMNFISNSMTDIHCSNTGAPTEFMNVIFMSGNSLKNNKGIILNANVRQGGNRGEYLLNTMKSKLEQALADITELPTERVEVNLMGFEASWAIEGGMILPDPGDDEAWLERKNVTSF